LAAGERRIVGHAKVFRNANRALPARNSPWSVVRARDQYDL
jgi:hypothetical protein